MLSRSQLRGSQTQWMHLGELKSRQCHLAPLEHAALISWLPASQEQTVGASAEASELPIAMEDVAPDSGSHSEELLWQQLTRSAARMATADFDIEAPPIAL
jgi:hypothetical protein